MPILTSLSVKNKGFTLIELLVTISIIALLAAIGLTTYTTILKQGRDSKRQSDLRSLQSALEQYYADQQFYPFKNAIIINSVTINGLQTLLNKTAPPAFTSSVGNPVAPSSTKTYMNALPRDPSATAYKYDSVPAGCDNSSANACTSYCLYAKVEIVPNPPPPPPAGCSYSVGYTFALSQP